MKHIPTTKTACLLILTLICNALYCQILDRFNCRDAEQDKIVTFPFEISSITVNTSTSPPQIVSIAEDGTLLFETAETFGDGFAGASPNTIATCLTDLSNDYEGIVYLFERDFRFYYAVLFEGSSTNNPNELVLVSTDATSGSNVSNCRIETETGLQFAFRNGSRLRFNDGDGLEGVTIDHLGFFYFAEENEGSGQPKLYKSIQSYEEISDFPDDALIIIEEISTSIEDQDFYGESADFSDLFHLSLVDTNLRDQILFVSEVRKEIIHIDLSRPDFFRSKSIADLQIANNQIYKPEGITIVDDFIYIISDNQTNNNSLTHFKIGALPTADAAPINLFPDSTGGIQLGAFPQVDGWTYEWMPEETLNDPFIAQPIANPDTTTTYALRVTNELGCSDVSAYTLVVTVNRDMDNDGFSVPEDCDDTDPSINPNAIDFPDNGIDEDCDGEEVLSGIQYFSGTVKDIDGEGIGKVAVTLTSGQSTITDENGFFEFDNVVIINSVGLEFERDDDHVNGLSSVDLVRIVNHILDLNPLMDDISLLAADVNDDGAISSLDIVLLLRVILGLSERFSEKDSWEFVPESFSLTEVPATALEIIGYKVGDVNSSANNN